MELTQTYLRTLFNYKNGVLFYISDDSIAGNVYKYKSGYRCSIAVNGKVYFRSRLTFLYHYGYLPKIVDHENRNTMDDRIENLRAATYTQNNTNRTSQKNATSQYLGVNYHKKYDGWYCRIRVNGQSIDLGVFVLEMDAALTYNKYAVMYHKEFASLNIIRPFHELK